METSDISPSRGASFHLKAAEGPTVWLGLYVLCSSVTVVVDGVFWRRLLGQRLCEKGRVLVVEWGGDPCGTEEVYSGEPAVPSCTF